MYKSWSKKTNRVEKKASELEERMQFNEGDISDLKKESKSPEIQSINQSTLLKHGKCLSKLVFRHAVW